MSGLDAASFAGSIAVGGVCAAAFLPAATDWALRRARRRMRVWWWDCLRQYRRFRAEHPGAPPSSRARGWEGALALWLEDSARLAREGHLPRDRIAALAAQGVSLEGAGRCGDEAEAGIRPARAVPLHERFLCAAAGAASAALTWLLPFCAAPSACAAAALAAMLVGVSCDVRERMIPLECSMAVAVAGAACQLLVAGVSGVAIGAVGAIGAVAVCAAANRLLSRSGSVPVGQGDVRCMAALSLASGSGVLAGAFACYAAAAAFSLAGLAARRLTLRDGIPFAPFLAVWLGVGVAASAM